MGIFTFLFNAKMILTEDEVREEFRMTVSEKEMRTTEKRIIVALSTESELEYY